MNMDINIRPCFSWSPHFGHDNIMLVMWSLKMLCIVILHLLTLLNQCLQNSMGKKLSGNKDASGKQAKHWGATSLHLKQTKLSVVPCRWLTPNLIHASPSLPRSSLKKYSFTLGCVMLLTLPLNTNWDFTHKDTSTKPLSRFSVFYLSSSPTLASASLISCLDSFIHTFIPSHLSYFLFFLLNFLISLFYLLPFQGDEKE